MPLNIVTHNVNGFDRNKDFVQDICCSLPPCIYSLQEHWLRPPSKRLPGVNILKSFHPDLDGWGTSAMQSSMETRIRSGRPFGGTGYVWAKSLSSAIMPRGEYRHDRVTVLEISSNRGSILIINAYLPFFDTNNIASQAQLYADTLGYIDSILDDNPNSGVILLGDMNCNYYNGANQHSVLLRNFIEQRNLSCTYDSMSSFDASNSYTRFNLKQGSFSLLDYVFVSNDLIPYIVDTKILDSGDVLSDHIPVMISMDVEIKLSQTTECPIPSIVDWRAIDEPTRRRYEAVMDECLDCVQIPFILHGDHLCNDSSHLISIEKYYNDLLQCVKTADLQLPRCKPMTKKAYWNDELSTLKNDSIVAHDLWKLNNCPKSGPIFEVKKHAYYKYKLAIRDNKAIIDQHRVDNLNENLLTGDHCKFWKSFKYFNYDKRSQSARVDGLHNDTAIANCFAQNFSRVYESNDATRSSILHDEFNVLYDNYYAEHIHDSINSLYLSWSEMMDVLSNLEVGKATASFLKAEHVLYGSPKLARHIHLLFNAMIQHCYVPQEFLTGSITPLIKDSQGDHNSPDNYRGLTIGVVFSNLFEHALLKKIGHLLHTDPLQFGYKKRHSTSHAIHALKYTIDYFTSRGSNVFAAFLDCSKGFNKVDHNGIFIKLIQRNVPL